ncbi:MAG: hypothetical protein ABS918_04490, partial [Saccharopolyspora rectivirgula]
ESSLIETSGNAAPSAVQSCRNRVECGTTDQQRLLLTAFRTGCVTVNMKKILTWLGIAFVLFFLITAPTQASDVVQGILGSLRMAAESVITFMQNLFL